MCKNIFFKLKLSKKDFIFFFSFYSYIYIDLSFDVYSIT